MKYVVINRASDGRHITCHATLLEAQWKMERMIGQRSTPFVVGRDYYSDWGNVLVIEERPDTWTASLETRLADAFDARECGIATPAQLALLEKNDF
jgi:hypothetical protein